MTPSPRLLRPALLCSLILLAPLAAGEDLPAPAAPAAAPAPAPKAPARKSAPLPAIPALRVLLLDYNEPIEHDVLVSHLCVERCNAANRCPEEYVKDGVDYFSNDFVVYRPQYLGESANFLVEAYGARRIDLLSFSGHHSSGFSGYFDRGRFSTEKLRLELADVADWQPFFTSPSMVLLQGCWTDVKEGFDKDPIAYIRHVIEDTEVRPGESSRLIAAVNQIAAGKQAYRELFPNACLLGYAGSQVPGGLLEIYGQVNGALRGIAARQGIGLPADLFHFDGKSPEELEALLVPVDKECGGSGWPCNLCRKNAGQYQPLARSLASFLRQERKRLDAGVARPEREAKSFERQLEVASHYHNASWSCSVAPPGTPPVLPPPIDRAPYAQLFLELLTSDQLGNIDLETRISLDAELVHFLGGLTLNEEQRESLRKNLTEEPGAGWLKNYLASKLQAISSSRQRDLFDFFAEISCADCFRALPQDPASWILRENAASRLRPELGGELLAAFFADPVARVRRAVVEKLDPARDGFLLERALEDPDEQVKQIASQRLAAMPVP
jgi:hypothetical protein